MAKDRMDLTTFVGKLLKEDDADILRDGIQALSQMIMEAEVSSKIGALPYERSDARTAYRNGYRSRTWDTRVGTIELKIPKVTAGTYFPSLLEPRRRAEKALQAVIVEAYVKGVSTRKVDDLVRALGIDGISKSEVSRMCKALDHDVDMFLGRPIDDDCPYMWLDATFHKVRELGRVVSVATVVAVGVTEDGQRHVLGCDTGPSEDHVFWTRFLRALVKRGLRGVRLVVSDSHEGLKAAVAKVFPEASWQRSSVHNACGREGPARHPHRWERALAARPERSSGRPAPPVGGGLFTRQWESCSEHRDERRGRARLWGDSRHPRRCAWITWSSAVSIGEGIATSCR